MTTLEHANVLLDELRSGAGCAPSDRATIISILSALIQDRADACNTILLQAARLRALESELATLHSQIVAAMSDAGPEAPEDERSA